MPAELVRAMLTLSENKTIPEPDQVLQFLIKNRSQFYYATKFPS